MSTQKPGNALHTFVVHGIEPAQHTLVRAANNAQRRGHVANLGKKLSLIMGEAKVATYLQAR